MTRKAIPAEAFDHGDPKRYRRGCRCRKCITGVTAEVRRGRYLRATGRSFLTTPDKAAQHIGRLRAAGMADQDMYKTARIAPNCFYRILRREGQIRRSTEQRIIAIPVPAQYSRGSGTHVPALGTVRRLRTLAADGWTATELGRRAGKHKQFIVYLQNMDGAGRVRMWVADYVRRLYDELAALQPDDFIAAHVVERTRKHAAAKDWPSSAYWDADDFDNPDFVPATSDELGRRELGALRRHEIRHLTSCALPEHEIADRLGMARTYVHDLIRDMSKAA
ncbi:hypothetical protein [Streptomyces lavendulocolor]|uniref:hypothetical protein n=1 Tax=Streptomyces lavendulocolor TaxID=67316 RepID=UPI0034064824